MINFCECLFFFSLWRLHWRDKNLVISKTCEDLLCVYEDMRHIDNFPKLIIWLLHLFSTKFHDYFKYTLLISDMDEQREQCGAQIVELFHPIEFSNIPGFPNFGHGVGNIYKWLPVFHGNYGDSTIWHVKSFLQLMANSNVLYEDNMMEMFLSTF